MTTWWRTPLIIAPILILFTGIIGLIFCLKSDLLLSLYSIPYIAIFLLGTIWFKAIKKHLLKSKLKDTEAFRVCLSKSIANENGYAYLIFTNGQKRHNEHFINKISTEISNQNIDKAKIKSGRTSTLKQTEEAELLITKISNNKLKKSIANISLDSTIPLLFIDNKNTFVILKRDQIN